MFAIYDGDVLPKPNDTFAWVQATAGPALVCGALFELLKRHEDSIAQLLLRRAVDERTQQRVRATLAVDRVASRRKRDVASFAVAPLPDRKPHQLEPLERSLRKVQLRIRELARRVAPLVGRDLDRHQLLLAFSCEPLATSG